MYIPINSGILLSILLLFKLKLSKFNDDYILAGCSGLHEVKLFDMNRDQ